VYIALRVMRYVALMVGACKRSHELATKHLGQSLYLYWARFFIRWHGRNGSMRHPKDMGKPEVESFLTLLANERQVSPATHRQALNALLFLYKQVMGQTSVWLRHALG
jgi:hypothetical protein